MLKTTKPNQPPKPQPQLSLAERIQAFRSELEVYLESKVDAIKAECPGVPRDVLRRLLENRAPAGCVCQQVLIADQS